MVLLEGHTTFSENGREAGERVEADLFVCGTVWPTFYRRNILVSSYLPIEWNLIRLSSPTEDLWSYSWNGDHNCTQNSTWGRGALRVGGDPGSGSFQGHEGSNDCLISK